jgi:hypothetical protein
LSASIRFRSFLHQALVMKATRTAPVDKLVVVIDDDPLILEATEGLLQSWGCCVVTAQSCEEALNPLRIPIWQEKLPRRGGWFLPLPVS